MAPQYPVFDAGYSGFVCIKSARNFRMWNALLAKLSDFQNITILKFVKRVFFSVCSTSLLSHVCHVLLMRAQKKMRGVAAWGVVATVKTVDFFRYFLKRKFPRDAVSYFNFAVHSKMSIASRKSATLPFPALVWTCLFNLGPKSFRNGFRLGPSGECRFSLKFWRSRCSHFCAGYSSNFAKNRSCILNFIHSLTIPSRFGIVKSKGLLCRV